VERQDIEPARARRTDLMEELEAENKETVLNEVKRLMSKKEKGQCTEK
jgi:hypothetical protein